MMFLIQEDLITVMQELSFTRGIWKLGKFDTGN